MYANSLTIRSTQIMLIVLSPFSCRADRNHHSHPLAGDILRRSQESEGVLDVSGSEEKKGERNGHQHSEASGGEEPPIA